MYMRTCTSVQLGVVLLFQWSEPEHGPGLAAQAGLDGNQGHRLQEVGDHTDGGPGKIAHMRGEGGG